ncbi:hypothetical protein HDV02_000242 [Globomyces sp. JEL0801]|nr:hypothetical protein HDV02_000242 [Globomyces sp. JEL0801]
MNYRRINRFNQTSAIFKLNLRRYLRNPLKYGLIIILIFVFIPFIIKKTSSFGNYETISYSNGYPFYPYSKIYIEKANLNPTQQTELNEKFQSISSMVNYTFRSDYLNNSDYNGFLLSFSKLDVSTSTYSYNLTIIGQQSLTNLWLCVTPKVPCYLGFMDPSVIAYYKLLIDSLLIGNATQQYTMISYYDVYFNVGKYFNYFNDWFFYVLGMMMVGMMIEERKKGIKFGLFQTGVWRSSYYVGTLSVPFLTGILFDILAIALTIDAWTVSSAIGPLIIFITLSSLGYLGFFWLLSFIFDNDKNAYVVGLIYVAGGSIIDAMKQDVSRLPRAVIGLLCINPRTALSMYVYASGFSSNNGFSNESIPITAPSDWLQVSKDETRPIYYLFTQFIKKNVAKVNDEIEIQRKIETSEVFELDASKKVQIESLSKRYTGCATNSLTNVSFEFAKGEVFGLLGFNGAGKSTLINALVGVISPTAGSIKVFGLEAKFNRILPYFDQLGYQIAANTGICAQDDILYDNLTARDHLYYFGLMKGVEAAQIHKTIKELDTELDFGKSLDTPTSKLSGGQKRKLSLALAFIHDPELVVLDEVSSGVDPENRRIFWKFIQSKKEGRAILLCTHFMDEADIVAGRKAVLSQGQLICIGSSEYLKSQYNTGYTLTVIKNGDVDNNIFLEWFRVQGSAAKLLKSTKEFSQFKLSDLKLIQKFETDSIKDTYKSFSVKENGLEAIFSSQELVDEKELNLSNADQERLLNYLSKFSKISLFMKTKFYFKFELKKTLANVLEIYLNLFIAIVAVTILWILFHPFSPPAVTTETINMNSAILEKLVPNDAVMETDIVELLSNSRFVPFGTTGSRLNLGNITVSEDRYLISTHQSMPGGVFLAAQALVKSDKLQSSLEYLNVNLPNYQRPVDTIFIGIIVLQIYSDILQSLSDLVFESKQKIKYLLLTSGVPLISYWIVTLSRNFLLVIPIIAIATAAVPTSYPIPPNYIFVYLLQTIFFSALLGSILTKPMLKLSIFVVRFIGILVLILVVIVGPLSKWTEKEYKTVSLIMIWFSPWSPISAVLLELGRITKLSENSMLLESALIYLCLFFLLFAICEMNHLLIKRVDNVSGSFISISNVVKRFGWKLLRTHKVAVSNLNLEINKNEFVALLGPNGCGKTTTLSMLTGQCHPSSGAIHVDSFHVTAQILNVIPRIGYCPQFDDLLISNMTVGAHLRFFCSMNGLKEDVAEGFIDLLLLAYGISKFKNVNCGNLSGGTKRKVSTVIATMLPRSLIVLDESSTGLDPLARQKLWNTVTLLNKDRTTIMTTHYVNETSVCDRIAIMASGNLKGFDTELAWTTSTKGYRASIHFSKPVDNFVDFCRQEIFNNEEVEIKVNNVLGSVVLTEFKDLKISFGTIITRLESLKDKGVILFYSIGRMDLEDVFLTLCEDDTSK